MLPFFNPKNIGFLDETGLVKKVSEEGKCHCGRRAINKRYNLCEVHNWERRNPGEDFFKSKMENLKYKIQNEKMKKKNTRCKIKNAK